MVIGVVGDPALSALEYHRSNEAVPSSEVLQALCVCRNATFPSLAFFIFKGERERTCLLGIFICQNVMLSSHVCYRAGPGQLMDVWKCALHMYVTQQGLTRSWMCGNVLLTHVLQSRAWPGHGCEEMCSWFQLSINFQDLSSLDLYP